MMKQYAPALKHIADIIEKGIREHPGKYFQVEWFCISHFISDLDRGSSDDYVDCSCHLANFTTYCKILLYFFILSGVVNRILRLWYFDLIFKETFHVSLLFCDNVDPSFFDRVECWHDNRGYWSSKCWKHKGKLTN